MTTPPDGLGRVLQHKIREAFPYSPGIKVEYNPDGATYTWQGILPFSVTLRAKDIEDQGVRLVIDREIRSVKRGLVEQLGVRLDVEYYTIGTTHG